MNETYTFYLIAVLIAIIVAAIAGNFWITARRIKEMQAADMKAAANRLETVVGDGISLDTGGQIGFETAGMLNALALDIHRQNYKWWVKPDGSPLERNVGEMLMLCVSELAEGMEGDRRDLADTHLKHRKMLEVELADTVIRVLDMSAGLGLDIGGAMAEKLRYNQTRADHQQQARSAPGGKRY